MADATKVKDIYPISTFIHDLSVTLAATAPPDAGTEAGAEAGATNPIPARRLIIVGDVHGSRKSLEALLEEVGFDRALGDLVIFAGDLVSKGADSGGVIDLAGTIGALGVRGNHDDAVLRAAADRRRETGQAEEEEGVSASVSVSTRTAETLSGSQLGFLASLPLMVRVAVTPSPASLASLPRGVRRVVVVHAGLVPGVALEEQCAHAVMHMRSLGREEGGGRFVPLEEPGERGWMAEWDEWQEGIAEGDRTMVVFGHDAKRGLQRGRYALGLDTSCVYGGRLSAWVVGAGGARVVQVDCVDERD
ncbi:Ser/Thr protein phosphatase family protein [Metarhizium album ARSEF 1941]|uniref:Ser/Thr protein phosphatase family protein n=1 Tax=Metarhizium album (strain ARSEF 1941) TaxID=1081103 RepID=A0A0B2WUH9_METAS|nr:Ser/Thr protein phosphatase family protein [Metarhizium album ARSEF 1941]KHN97723.1 Ser/Thr protein phosphatase family protein [Metarhizium album ARSEF 1941]